MHEVTRTIRFHVHPDPAREAAARARRDNTFAGWPSAAGLAAYYELSVTCRGEPDAATGYLVDIAEIDAAAREVAIPIITEALRDGAAVEPALALGRIRAALADHLDPSPSCVRWHLSPYHSIAMSGDRPHRIELRQQFEFAAAHRLHVPNLSAEENRRIFGKCNTLHGHGHNYRLEVSASTQVDAQGVGGLSLLELERIVAATVIQRFDHTHLNLDTAEFASLNPSVENITRVCHDLLVEPIAAAGGRLVRVTVWETAKTSCSYPVASRASSD